MSDTRKHERDRGISRGQQFITRDIRKRETRKAHAAIRQGEYDTLEMTDTNTRKRIHGRIASW